MSLQSPQAPLLEWFQTGAPPNQKELVGLCRAMLAVRPDRSAASLNLLLESARWIKKHIVEVKFAWEIDSVRSHLDSIFLASWQQNKKDKVLWVGVLGAGGAWGEKGSLLDNCEQRLRMREVCKGGAFSWQCVGHPTPNRGPPCPCLNVFVFVIPLA